MMRAPIQETTMQETSMQETPAQDTPKRRSRDILNFIHMRNAIDADDGKIGQLLVRAFSETYAAKLPQVVTTEERVAELLGVGPRRHNGAVVVLELGYRIIGTFAIIHPDSRESQSWIRGAANLRCLALDPDFHGFGFSEVLLSEAERIAHSWSAPCICLHVQQGAVGVAKLYQRRGYIREPLGDIRCHGNWVEAYSLSVSLPVDGIGVIHENHSSKP